IGLAEILDHDLVDLREMPEVGQENRRLDDVVEAGAGGRNDRLQVFEYPARLYFDVALDQFLGERIQRDLTREPQGIAGPDGLRIGADGGGGGGRANKFLAHGVDLAEGGPI